MTIQDESDFIKLCSLFLIDNVTVIVIGRWYKDTYSMGTLGFETYWKDINTLKICHIFFPSLGFVVLQQKRYGKSTDVGSLHCRKPYDSPTCYLYLPPSTPASDPSCTVENCKDSLCIELLHTSFWGWGTVFGGKVMVTLVMVTLMLGATTYSYNQNK